MAGQFDEHSIGQVVKADQPITLAMLYGGQSGPNNRHPQNVLIPAGQTGTIVAVFPRHEAYQIDVNIYVKWNDLDGDRARDGLWYVDERWISLATDGTPRPEQVRAVGLLVIGGSP